MRKIILGMLVIPAFANATVSDGGYVGIEAGVANQIINFTPLAFNMKTNNATLYNTALGLTTRMNLGYNADEYNGFELGASYTLPSNTEIPTGISNINSPIWSFDGSYLLYLPTTIRKLSVVGRIGMAYNWMPATNGVSTLTTNNSISGSNFSDVFGAGIKYNISRSMSFRLEWIGNGIIMPMTIKMGNQDIGTWSNQTFQMGFNYHF